MLKRIKIQGYKSLVDLEVNFGHLAVLVGPNASGKSNFLDALHLLSRVATNRTLKEAFDPPYRGHALESFTFGKEGIKSLLEQETVSFSIEVDVQLSPKVVESVNRQIQEVKRMPLAEGESVSRRSSPTVRAKNLRYRIEIEMFPKLGVLRVADEYLAALNANGELNQKRKPFLEQIDDRLHCEWRGKRVQATMSEVSIIASFQWRIILLTIHIWLRCERNWRVGLPFILSRVNACGSQVLLRKFTISG